MQIEKMKHLSAYNLEASPMTQADVPKLHELSVSVSWPHRAEDWAMLIAQGEGIVARDEIGRVVGSAMWFALKPGYTSIGMVITSPRLQAHGTGRWLMEHVLQQADGAACVLNATRAAIRLYVSLGFMPIASVYQHNGTVVKVPEGPAGSRPMAATDHAAILALDHRATGMDRAGLVNALIDVSKGTVIERNGQVQGFALCRRFGRGHVVGPVVAENEEDAIALVRPHVIAHQGSFLRLDTRQGKGPLRSFLQEAGLVHYDTVMRMRLGELPAEEGVARTIGLASQALG